MSNSFCKAVCIKALNRKMFAVRPNHCYGRMKHTSVFGCKETVSEKNVSSYHEQSAEPSNSNSSPRLRFVLELRK